MMRRFASLALAVIVPAFLLAAPAFGQSHGGGSGGGSHGGGGGGGHSGGGSSSGGSHASGGGARSGGGGAARSGATGGSGTAVALPRGAATAALPEPRTAWRLERRPTAGPGTAARRSGPRCRAERCRRPGRPVGSSPPAITE